MIDERHQDLAALHAFGLLEDAERDGFVAELAQSAELRQCVAEFCLAASGLAHVAPAAEPPPELRARVLASAAASRPAGARSGQVVAFPSWVPWLAAAVLALAALGLFRHGHQLAEENRRLQADALAAVAALRDTQGKLEAERTAAERQLSQTQAQLAQAKLFAADTARRLNELAAELRSQGDLARLKIATLASMLGNSPAAVAVAVWDPARSQGVLAVSKLPATTAAQDYQLWLVDPRQAQPVSGGTFVVDPATGEAHVVFHADKPVGAVAKFAVSLERKGGVPVREGPIVLLGP